MKQLTNSALSVWLRGMNASPLPFLNLCSEEARQVIIADGWKMGIGWPHFTHEEAGVFLDRLTIWFQWGYSPSTTRHELSHPFIFHIAREEPEQIQSLLSELYLAVETGNKMATGLVYGRSIGYHPPWWTFYTRDDGVFRITPLYVWNGEWHPDKSNINYWEVFAELIHINNRSEVPVPLRPLVMRFVHPRLVPVSWNSL